MVDSVHILRMVALYFKYKALLAKVFTELGPGFQQRPGGYTRILKLGPRPSDATEMVILELVDRPEEQDEKKKKTKVARAEKKAAKKTAEKSEADE